MFILEKVLRTGYNVTLPILMNLFSNVLLNLKSWTFPPNDKIYAERRVPPFTLFHNIKVTDLLMILPAARSGFVVVHDCDDEPEPDFDWNRLSELQRRNTLCLPHQRTSYPVEVRTSCHGFLFFFFIGRFLSSNWFKAGLSNNMSTSRAAHLSYW